MGIIICGLNGAGKSSLGKVLAERLGYIFIDNEDLYFPKTDSSYMFSNPRSKAEAEHILDSMISENNHFVYAAVKGEWGDNLSAALDCVILIEVPKEVRMQRVRNRSHQKFGDRILPGGDLYEKETAWFSYVESRPENYLSEWLEHIDCPIIRVDGTLPIQENVDHLLQSMEIRNMMNIQ